MSERSRRLKMVVTGGAGFIGSHLVERLIDNGHDVLVIDDFSTGRWENLANVVDSDRLSVFAESISVSGYEDSVIDYQPDYIFHLAAQTSVPYSVRYPFNDARVNVIGTLGMLECAWRAGVRKFVFMSSGGAIYGETGCPSASEDDPKRPLSPYGASKLAAHHWIDVYQQIHGVPCAIVAPSNVYGPRQAAAAESGVISIFADAIMRGVPCQIYGDGTSIRDFVYVSDVVDALMLIAEQGSGLYNVSTGVGTRISELIQIMENVVGTSIERVFLPTRPGDIRHSVLRSPRARELGWESRVPLEQGIADLFADIATVRRVS